MLENAYYSVISPESCAAIIYRDSGKAPEAAEALHMTADDLLSMKVIDGIIPEPPGGAHLDHQAVMDETRKVIRQALAELAPLSPEQRIEHRYKKFREMGNFFIETAF